MQVITSWTAARAHALQRSLRMTNQSFAAHLGVSVRSVAGWHQKPGTVLAQATQEILDAALEQAPELAKAQFTALVSEVSSHEGGTDEVPLLASGRVVSPGQGLIGGQRPGQEPVFDMAGHDAGGLGDGLGWLPDLDRSVSLLDRLAVADLADSPAAQAECTPAAVPGLITGFLFSGQLWPGGQEPSGQGPGGLAVPAPGGGAAAAGRIRAFTHSLMDLDFHYGGGHVRRVLLFYFRSEIVPLLCGQHPERVRRELFSAAAEVAELLGWSAYDAGRHGAAQEYFARGLRLAGEAAAPVLGARLMSSLSHQANYLGYFRDALQLARAAQSAAVGRATPTVHRGTPFSASVAVLSCCTASRLRPSPVPRFNRLVLVHRLVQLPRTGRRQGGVTRATNWLREHVPNGLSSAYGPYGRRRVDRCRRQRADPGRHPGCAVPRLPRNQQGCRQHS
jgi:hypothetical protein